MVMTAGGIGKMARAGVPTMVFNIIQVTSGPLSADDMFDRLKPSRLRIAPPTYYRAPEHPIRLGAVRRVESLNAHLPTDRRAPGTVVSAICDDCGRVQQRATGAEVGRITRALVKDGFHPTHPVVEAPARRGDSDDTLRTGRKA